MRLPGDPASDGRAQLSDGSPCSSPGLSPIRPPNGLDGSTFANGRRLHGPSVPNLSNGAASSPSDQTTQPGRAPESSSDRASQSSIALPRPMSGERRRRHASSGEPATENGLKGTHVTENGAVPARYSDNYNSHNGLNMRDPVARIRHSSVPGWSASGSSSPGLPSRYSTPCQSANFPVPPTAPLVPHIGRSTESSPCRESLASVVEKEPPNEEGLPVPARIVLNSIIRSNAADARHSHIYHDANDKFVESHEPCQPPVSLEYKPAIIKAGDGRKSPPIGNYVPCVEVEKDLTFRKSPSEDEPLKGSNYSEFTYDKSGFCVGITSKNVESPPHHYVPKSHQSPGIRSIHRSKAPSVLSLNFSWKKNYIPFRSVNQSPCGEGIARAEASHEPLMHATSACQEESCTATGDLKAVVFTAGPVGPGSGWNWREELTLRNLRLDHPAPHLFVTGQWQQHSRMSCLYLAYRLFWAMYFSTWAVWSLVGFMDYDAPWSIKVHYFTYLTNWSIWLLAYDTALQAANVVLHMRRIADVGEYRYQSMNTSLKSSWVASNIAFSAHVFVTIGYWATVYPLREDQAISVIGINTHVVPGMYVFLDAFISAAPRRLLHAWHSMLYFTTYTIFTALYYVFGGTDYLGGVALYPFLDWSKPVRSAFVVSSVIVVLAPLLHSGLCGIYALRVRLWRRYRLARYLREEGDLERSTKYDEQIV